MDANSKPCKMDTLHSAYLSAKPILVPHYITNIILSISYILLKTLPPVCELLFDDCNLDLKEWEMLTFLGCIIVMKNRKQAAARQYISTVCLFAKVLAGYMFFKTNSAYGIIFAVFCLVQMIFFPEPVYRGPEQITYFRGPHLEEELERDKRITWVVTFFAAWSPPCVSFSSIFAELSNDYNLENLKFGKIDVAKFPDVGQRFNIDSGSFSKQLPTLILFREGKEEMRKPFISPKGTVVRYSFVKESIIRDFELPTVYKKCKENPLRTRKLEEKKEN